MDKNKALTKKLNEYTRTLTPGQITKMEPYEVNHYYKVYLDREPSEQETSIYKNHPDNKQLIKDLLLLRRTQEKKEKQAQQAQEQYQNSPTMPRYTGSGGPIQNFGSQLAEGASRIGQQVNQQLGAVPTTPIQSFPALSNAVTTPATMTPTTGKGYRTDRHNNPTAFTTAVAANAGLVPNKDYTQGDPFVGGDGRVYYTAKLLGDPIATTIKAIDNMGFFTAAGKPRWSYLSSIPGIQNWNRLTYSQKANIISQMYKHEGGSGSLLKGGQGGGQGDPIGNITTQFGQPTKDTNFHTGVDFANRPGTPIPKLLGTGGQVSYVGQNGDYGNQVAVKNDNGMTETYSHLRRSAVRPGQRVDPGQEIGQMGHTGNAWSASGGPPDHLHYEIIDAYNNYVNPLNYTQG